MKHSITLTIISLITLFFSIQGYGANDGKLCRIGPMNIKAGRGLPLFPNGRVGRGILPASNTSCDHTVCHDPLCEQGVNIDEDCLQRSSYCIPRICTWGYGCATPPYQCLPGDRCVNNQCVPGGGGGGRIIYGPQKNKEINKSKPTNR